MVSSTWYGAPMTNTAAASPPTEETQPKRVMVRLNNRVYMDEHAALVKAAEAKGRPINEYVREAIRAQLAKDGYPL